jgi:RNA polymerase sigma-70 factor (ECF subfamily)
MVNLEDAEPLYINFRSREAGLHEQTDDPAALVIGKLGEERVSEAIAQLPEEFRVVCTLYFMEDLAYQDIAGILGCPVGTVRSRLHRGRRMLQRSLWHLAQAHGIVPASPATEEVR